jgi:phospholipase/carboxylesterase
MNRLEQWLKSAAIVLDTYPEGSERAEAIEPSEALREAVNFFLPEHYEAGYAYPLVIWLHGSGEDERQLSTILPELSLRNYVGVAPQGTIYPEFGPGYAWSEISEGCESAREKIYTAIDYAAARANIAPQRIFLAGRGEGGTMAIRLALQEPDRFAGALSFGGSFPRGQNVLSRLKDARGLPLFFAVGGDSLEYPTEQLCDDLKLCHLAWLSVFVKQYHPCADELVVDMMRDANEWMMNLVTRRSSPNAR